DTTVEISGAWTYKDLDHPIFQVIDQLTNDGFVAARIERRLSGGERDHRLGLHVLYQHGTVNAANYINATGGRGTLTASAHQRASNLEVSLEDEFTLGV